MENVGGGLRRRRDGAHAEDVGSNDDSGQRHRVSHDCLLRVRATRAERADRRASSCRSVIGARFDTNRREEDATHELQGDDYEESRDDAMASHSGAVVPHSHRSNFGHGGQRQHHSGEEGEDGGRLLSDVTRRLYRAVRP